MHLTTLQQNWHCHSCHFWPSFLGSWHSS
jgi:hypothetical protein